MKKFFSMRIAMATIAMAIFAIITACSSKGDAFSIDAHFLNMNMAQFFVYSPDGAIEGIDTINVNGGRFTYEHAVQKEGTVVIMFPNYATLPIFVKPGASIDIEGNAAHLKETKVTGTKENEVFTEWRLNSNELSPKEMTKHAELFINDHPDEPASRWLVRQYFILAEKPDYKKAEKMLKKMLTATDNNLQVSQMLNSLSRAGQLNIGDRLPRFSAKDINGNPVTNGALLKGTTVILVWSSYNYDSQNMLRQLAVNKRGGFSWQNNDNKETKKIDNIITICMDADVKQCRKTLKDTNAEELTTICDGTMWDNPLLKTLGITNIPDNIKLKDGKVVAKRVEVRELIGNR